MGARQRGMVLIDRAGARRLSWLFLFLGVLWAAVYVTLIRMPGKKYAGPFEPLTAAERRACAELERMVYHLAGEIGPRNYIEGGLDEAADWLAAEFEAAGLSVERQTFIVVGEDCSNLIVEIPGKTDEVVVVGGHYDSVATESCPAANDNASGAAATLLLAKAFADRTPARTLRFVEFVNEEPPSFWTEAMGSLVYARSCAERGDRIAAMLSLETIGYYSDEPGSQEYPGPFAIHYGTTGDFIGFVGDIGSRRLVRRCVGTFRRTTSFPSHGIAAPAVIPGVGWSDQWSFWKFGYPAVMVSDTAVFRYPYYHTSEDTPEKLDYRRMARVVCGLGEVIADLAGCEPPVF